MGDTEHREALSGLVAVRVRLGDDWVIAHPDDVELVFMAGTSFAEQLPKSAEENERLREAIERHRQQIKAREAGRRISSVAADETLWAVINSGDET